MSSLKRFFTLVCLLLLMGLSSSSYGAGAFQEQEQSETIRRILALTYPEGPTLGIKFGGTHRLPQASGEAKVERKRGTTEIELELDELKPATLFGGDYATYVLWAVSPEGLLDNLGELILRGNRSKLNVTTSLEKFGMFVTAEPHFLVDLPSRFVVLENTRPTRELGLVSEAGVKYQGFQGIYHFVHESLARMPEAKGEVRTHLESAQIAVELARRARAGEFAAEEFQNALASLRQFERAGPLGRGNEMLSGHKVVREAVEAQKLAEERAFQASLDAERAAYAEELSGLEDEISEAKDAADKAALEAERKALEAEIETRARLAAEARASAASRYADEMARQARLADEASRRAAAQRRQAEEEARKMAAAKLAAERDAEEARLQRERAREQLGNALARVAEVRDTARGLIVSLPSILFDFDRATLRPEGRETLAKIVGILHFVEGYDLSIEGHTDNVGSEEYNQKLSERRAQGVNDYLVANGVSADLLKATGYGESKPLTSNDNSQGREKNRRVEIVFVDPEQAEAPVSEKITIPIDQD